jgi:hypothetical protein
MLPDDRSLDRGSAPKAACLYAQIRRDISALHQLVDDSWSLIEDVRRQRAARTQVRAIGLTDRPTAHK